MNSQIELTQAAKLAHMELDEFYLLNPGYNHWATAPNGPYDLVLPIENTRTFRTTLSKTPKSNLVGWKKHVVKDGETLSGIAAHYLTEVNLLEETNQSLNQRQLKVNEILRIPVNDEGINDHSKVSRQRRIVVKKTQSIGPKQIIHIVKPGDDLGHLGKEYSTTSSAIRYWNQLEHNDALKVGRKLVIWKARPRNKKAITYYTIHHGDTLSGIAARFGTSIKELKAWNAAIGNDNQIYPNQKLMIYRGDSIRYYNVQKGDTLSAIAARFNVKLSDLKQWNNSLENAKYLYPEQRLVIAKNGQRLTYVVKSGDTLSAIAHRFNVSVGDLKKWNDFLHNNKYLYPDQRLLIYTA